MEVNEKIFAGGYVVLPIEEYQELIFCDIRNAASLEICDNSWSYGDVDVKIPTKYIRYAFADMAEEMFPGVVMGKGEVSVTIGKLPKELMDARLGKKMEGEEDDD